MDAEKGKVELVDGTTVEGDVVLGADGIYVSHSYRALRYKANTLQSKTRSCIKDMALFGSGKAAFRFLIPRQRGLGDPVTQSIAEITGGLVMWFSTDRRIVMYPCNGESPSLFSLCNVRGLETDG